MRRARAPWPPARTSSRCARQPSRAKPATRARVPNLSEPVPTSCRETNPASLPPIRPDTFPLAAAPGKTPRLRSKTQYPNRRGRSLPGKMPPGYPAASDTPLYIVRSRSPAPAAQVTAPPHRPRCGLLTTKPLTAHSFPLSFAISSSRLKELNPLQALNSFTCFTELCNCISRCFIRHKERFG
jgi:hypothetical protein